VLGVSEFLGSTLQIGEKERERYPERLGHFHDVLKAYIAFAALDRAHESPVYAALVGERFLGISLRQTQLSNTLPQRPKQNLKAVIHSPSVQGMTCLCLHCLRRQYFRSILIASEIEDSRGIGKELPAMTASSSLFGGGGGGGGGTPQSHQQ
jgi:hypothetical protein